MLPKFLTELKPVELYSSNNYVVLDFETDTSHGYYGSALHERNQMLLACWKLGPDHPVGQTNMQVTWEDEFGLNKLMEDIEAADYVVAHHAKYELMWLKRCGLDLSKVIVFDTMLAEYVLMGNLAAGDKMMLPKPINLDACCRRRGLPAKDPVVNIMMKHDINPVDMPRPWLQGRCERDVEETEHVFLDQREALRRTNRLPVLFTRCILTPVLSDVEFNGMALDKERVYEVYEEHVREFAQLNNAMDAMTGGINWKSPLQAGAFIYDTLKFPELRNKQGEPKRTAAGKRMTDKKTLEKLQATTAKQKEFIELRGKLGKVAAALSKSLEFFKGVVDEADGTFFAEFNQSNTATHRLSSSGIKMKFEQFDKTKQAQFQNLPNAFKRLFMAKREGWKIGEADGSQLEFRVAGALGKDSQIAEDIANHHDVHKFTASVLNNVPPEEVTKEQRKKAKADTFKPLTVAA